MTKLLQRGIKAVEALPPDRQDLAGEILLEIAGRSPAQYQLTPEQIEDLKESIAEADRGEFASDADIAETWERFENWRPPLSKKTPLSFRALRSAKRCAANPEPRSVATIATSEHGRERVSDPAILTERGPVSAVHRLALHRARDDDAACGEAEEPSEVRSLMTRASGAASP